MNSANNLICHLCNIGQIEWIPDYQTLLRVTSDCKPWYDSGKIGVCQHCRSVQKCIDEIWQAEVKKIYESYLIYFQSDGAEQRVFDGGAALPRSIRLVERFLAEINVKEVGRLLDVGCGNGALLSAFSQRVPKWSLVGIDLDDKYKSVVESIERVEKLYHCAPEKIAGTFDVITLIHSLEHVPQPKKLLQSLREKLSPQGFLCIQIPDYIENPFDLLVADHCTHFSHETITALLQSSGYEIVLITNQWVSRELTVIVRKTESQQPMLASKTNTKAAVTERIHWLKAVKKLAQNKMNQSQSFGIFGTSIAATWLFGELKNDPVAFFVDEDPNRVGKCHYDLPIYHPENVPNHSTVFIVSPTKTANLIKERMEKKYLFAMCTPSLSS